MKGGLLGGGCWMSLQGERFWSRGGKAKKEDPAKGGVKEEKGEGDGRGEEGRGDDGGEEDNDRVGSDLEKWSAFSRFPCFFPSTFNFVKTKDFFIKTLLSVEIRLRSLSLASPQLHTNKPMPPRRHTFDFSFLPPCFPLSLGAKDRFYLLELEDELST